MPITRVFTTDAQGTEKTFCLSGATDKQKYLPHYTEAKGHGLVKGIAGAIFVYRYLPIDEKK
jgi:hypothetical protein